MKATSNSNNNPAGPAVFKENRIPNASNSIVFSSGAVIPAWIFEKTELSNPENVSDGLLTLAFEGLTMFSWTLVPYFSHISPISGVGVGCKQERSSHV